MPFKACFLFISFFLVSYYAGAQNTEYKFSRLDITAGLSDNHINCIFKDGKGFMWFGTTSGLDRYDGYKFRSFHHEPKDPNSLFENNVIQVYDGPHDKLWVFTHSGISIYNAVTEKFSNNITTELIGYKIFTNRITLIKKDAEGDFWFLTKNAGLYCYHPKNNTTTFYGSYGKVNPILHSNYVMDMADGGNGNFWLIYNDGVIDQLDTKTSKITQQYIAIAKDNNNKQQTYGVSIDNQANLWVYSSSEPIGAYCYNTIHHTLLHYSKDAPQNKLDANIINNIIQTDDDKIWIGTDHGGINVIDRRTNKITYVVSKEDDPKSLSGNSITLYKDNSGIIWVGTFKQGINYYHSEIMQFPLVRHYLSDPNSLPFEDVNRFVEDESGNVWIGTNGGGLMYYNRTLKKFTQYKHDQANPNSLANDIVISLFIDHEHKLWIGTYFGGLDCFDGKTFTHYRHNDKMPGSLSDDRVYSIIEDSRLNLWVGTFAGGLNVLDRATNTFRHPQYARISDYTAIIIEDRQKNIWIGRDRGIDVLEKGTNKVKHYFYDPANQNSLIANDVNVIMQDSRGLMWIGTKGGLSILNPQTQKFINAEAGIDLPASDISNILEDKEGNMWISTPNGLASIKLHKTGDHYTFSINHYNELDGLQGREFNLNAAGKLRSGELIFGGSHGFNLFDPKMVDKFKPKLRLVFTDFQLYNKRVAVGDSVNGGMILNKSITETQAITLNHNENVFDISFSACDYFNPDKIRYQYTLEGFDKGWITSSTTDRKATYTNLDGGDYTFKVRAENTNNPGGDDMITLKIKVLPPFWKSPLAYLVYTLAAAGLILYMRHKGILKLRQEFAVAEEKRDAERKITREREEANRMHQLDLMKIKFFTNISHEFRTPLSLILSPIDDLLKIAEKPEQQHHLTMIKRNAKRLLNLVNQLVDFRKMEYNELKLCLAKGDIIQFIKDVSSSFTDVAYQKQIQYLFESEINSFITKFDHDKIERILFNLLSNAFKFTPPGGNISVMLGVAPLDELQKQKMLEIKIIDTGIGISLDNQEKIFERFFQDDIPQSLLNQGSGIGLSITREFIKMHGGVIRVESEPDYGSCFIISIPVGDLGEQPVAALPQREKAVSKVIKNNDGSPGAAKKPTILLIEDNDDLRFYLKDNLKQSFHIIEAVNGKEGWQKTLALHPKLIVSDVSMPEMNGIELCKKIKGDSRTAQIPIILLTAITREEEQLAGLENGANDYIIKPFNFEILLSKINNLLHVHQTFKKQIDVQSQDLVVVSEDEKFLKNAIAYIELNITNPNFSVEELSRHLALSRVSLYRKLLTLTGKTPVDCIRTIRLQRAVQLLEKSKLSIANVAYEVGFNNAAYFAKVFREEYGILPSEYIVEIRKKEHEDSLV